MTVEYKYLNRSIVLLASPDTNSTLFNAKLLEAQGIIPSGWSLKETPVFSPAFSAMAFANHIAFVCEDNKFQFTENDIPLLENGERSSPLASMVTAFYTFASHIEWVALGMNYTVIVPGDSATLLRRFMTLDISTPSPVIGLKSLQMELPLDRGVLNMTFSHGTAKQLSTQEVTRGLIVNANNHLPLSGLTADETLSLIGGFMSRQLKFEQELSKLLKP